MKTIYVVPVGGQSVPCPNRTLLPAEGARVPRNTWWLRRLKQGDVVEAAEPEKQVVVPIPNAPAADASNADAPGLPADGSSNDLPAAADASDEEGSDQ